MIMEGQEMAIIKIATKALYRKRHTEDLFFIVVFELY